MKNTYEEINKIFENVSLDSDNSELNESKDE